MFNFPWTNFHELNLDWILSVVKEAKEVFDNGRSDIDYAVSTADEAKTIATQAAQATIPDNSVSTAKIQDYAVNANKLSNYSVTEAKLQNAAVTTAKLANGAVTSAKIADGTIERGKLATALEKEVYGNTLTRFTIENVTDFQRNYYKEQNGNFYVWVNVGLPTAISASQVLYDFGSIFRPLFRAYGVCQDNAGHEGVAYIETDGKLYVAPPQGGSLSSYLYIAITATKNI